MITFNPEGLNVVIHVLLQYYQMQLVRPPLVVWQHVVLAVLRIGARGGQLAGCWTTTGTGDRLIVVNIAVTAVSHNACGRAGVCVVWQHVALAIAARWGMRSQLAGCWTSTGTGETQNTCNTVVTLRMWGCVA
jgi:hypothetical protein